MRNVKEASVIGLIGIGLIILASGCGQDAFKGDKGDPGAKGDKGSQGYGAGVFANSVVGLCGSVDGILVTTFQDNNNDGIQDSNELTTSVSMVCNGQNGIDGINGQDGHDGLNGTNGTNGAAGTNGTSSTVTVTSNNPISCGANGGYTLTVTDMAGSTSKPVCNGAKGDQGNTGPSGPQGVAGLNGLNGAPGSLITPVKFCNSDHTTYPEYGLMIDGRLFAVYWGTTPASPSSAQAFLAEIIAGNYYSTGGNGCSFTITSNGTVQ